MIYTPERAFRLAFGLSSDSLVETVFWGGVALLFLTFFLFALIFLMRLTLLKRNTGKRRLIDTWSPILESCMDQSFPDSIPKLKRNEVYTFLGLWLNLYETADENSREILALVAMQAGLPDFIERNLKQSAVRQKILLYYAMGALKDKHYWSVCLEGLGAENTFLSLSAGRALLQLDPKSAIGPVSEALAQRPDWPSARASMMLMESGMDLISQPIAQQIQKATIADLPRLLPYLQITRSDVALPILEKHLAVTNGRQEAILLACLQALPKFSAFQNKELLLPLLKHHNPDIRASAVMALSHYATFSEGLHIAECLSDSVPLVQYRAAQALLNLPNMTVEKLQSLRGLLHDSQAQDLLTRVIDEKRFGR